VGIQALRASLKSVKAPLRTTQGTPLLLELVHGDGRQAGSGMVAGGVMVDLTDRDGGVNDFGLDDLLLDQRLHSLVDMTVVARLGG
jgi:hypothetical protein